MDNESEAVGRLHAAVRAVYAYVGEARKAARSVKHRLAVARDTLADGDGGTLLTDSRDEEASKQVAASAEFAELMQPVRRKYYEAEQVIRQADEALTTIEGRAAAHARGRVEVLLHVLEHHRAAVEAAERRPREFIILGYRNRQLCDAAQHVEVAAEGVEAAGERHVNSGVAYADHPLDPIHKAILFLLTDLDQTLTRQQIRHNLKAEDADNRLPKSLATLSDALKHLHTCGYVEKQGRRYTLTNAGRGRSPETLYAG